MSKPHPRLSDVNQSMSAAEKRMDGDNGLIDDEDLERVPNEDDDYSDNENHLEFKRIRNQFVQQGKRPFPSLNQNINQKATPGQPNLKANPAQNEKNSSFQNIEIGNASSFQQLNQNQVSQNQAIQNQGYSNQKQPFQVQDDLQDNPILPWQNMKALSKQQHILTKQPMKTPPDTEMHEMNDTNYNTFSQPNFANGHQLQTPVLGSQHHKNEIPPVNMQIDLSEIQAHLSSMSNTNNFINQSEANQSQNPMGMSTTSNLDNKIAQFQNFTLNDDSNQILSVDENLQLSELQKVFELFHIQLENVREVVPKKNPGVKGFLQPNTKTQTRVVQKKTLKKHLFEEVQITDVVGQDTYIPHLERHRSTFFQDYRPDMFEGMFEDLKAHYQKLCEEEPTNDDEYGDEDGSDNTMNQNLD